MKFSFVVSAVRGEFLSHTLDSIAGQAGDLETVLVDDSEHGHGTRCLPESLASRTLVLENEVNRGRRDPTIVWNQGLQQASGEFVILVGDDDFIDPDYLEQMTGLIERFPDHDLYRCRPRVVDGTGVVQDVGFRLPQEESWDEFLYMRNRYLRPHATVEYCARRTKLLEIGGYASLPLALGSDDLTWLLMSLDRPIVSTNETYGNWRVWEGATSSRNQNRSARHAAHLQLFERERRVIEENEPAAVSRELLMEALYYRFQTFLNNAGVRGKMRRAMSYLLPSGVERILISRYKRLKNQDLSRHFAPPDE